MALAEGISYDGPAVHDLYAGVSKITRMLLKLDGRLQGELAAVLHIAEGGVSEKMTGKRHWTLEDVRALAGFFKVPVQLFFDDPRSVRDRLTIIRWKGDAAGRRHLSDASELRLFDHRPYAKRSRRRSVALAVASG